MKKKKTINRIKRFLSLFLAIAMVLDWTPLDGILQGIDGLMEKVLTEEYAEMPPILPEYVCAATSADFPDHEPEFNTTQDFVDFCYLYANDSDFAAFHQNDELHLTMMNDATAVKAKLEAGYVGLGTSQYPFGGTIKLPDNSDGYFEFTVNGNAFFNDVYASVKILSATEPYPEIKFQLKRTEPVGSGTDAPLFARHVTAAPEGKTPTQLNIELVDYTPEDPNASAPSYSGVIGEIRAGATVNLTYANKSGKAVVSNAANGQTDSMGDVGAVCGKMNNGSVLNLTYTETSSAYSITSANGNAGGLIGSMEGNATLNIVSMPAAAASKSVIANGTAAGYGYAGGLVGKISSAATIAFAENAQVGNAAATVFPVRGSITGVNGAGGLFGYYKNMTSVNEFDFADYDVAATVYGKNCGGLFGVLENPTTGDPAVASTMTIKNTGSTTLTATSGTGDYDSTGFFGGIVGRYVTNDLKNVLFLDGFSLTANSSDSFAAFGGAIGYVESSAYVKANGVSITATGTNKRSGNCDLTSYAYFGGLIGATAKKVNSNANGVLVDLGDFTLKTGSSGTEAYRGGGIVGTFQNGVLRLSGKTDLSAAKPFGGYSDTVNTSYGQLVGYNDNVLVYALGDGSTADGTAAYGTGWRFIRSNGAISDDLGTWGEVVRMVSTDGATFNNLEDAGIVTFDGTNHTVTLSAASSSIGNTADFAKTALNVMLNQGSNYDCLLFTSGAANARDGILGSTITLTDNVNLAGTGINGFMRDGSTTISASNVGGVGTFTGTLNGAGKTITLAIGESYGIGADGSSAASGEGSGLIYRHRYNGLFSVIGNGTAAGTVDSLTVDGTVNVHNAGPDGMNVGGIAARAHGGVTLNGVTASQTVNYHEGANAAGSKELGKNIGGFIGFVDNCSTGDSDDNGTIAITGTSDASPAINLSGHHESWVTYGGAIGKVTSKKITINVAQNGGDKLNVGMTADISAVTNVGADANGGGLIGYIISDGKYADRLVNIKNLEFDGCEVGNASNSAGGGFLGYAWLNTTTTIDGLTVKGNSAINNVAGNNVATAGNVGAICYVATGKWTVDSLSVSQMSMTAGAGTSLGMLINKAYDGNDGLYLNVLNAGYVLDGSGITLPASLGVYDELAAYSADGSALINGGNGTGVVSVNMNSDRTGTEAKMTVTGTYQNQLGTASSAALGNAKYANGKTRYYYNLDVMDSSDAGQKLLLWSVNKYAASNVKNEFGSSFSNVFSGNANMTGLSFYPVATADNTTIGNMTLTFDYDGIYATAENVFTNATTDGYVRDPGATNQHYLMHSGLFMNLPVGKTISISGNLVLKGTFLELAGSSQSAGNGYSGVLISRTMKGNLRSGDNSSIKLAGITPKTTGNAAYNGGYLLINNIVRDNTLVDRPELVLKNVYTSTESGETYAPGAIVASSLIGSASGQKLKIEFSKIRLDSRTTALSGNAGLDAAYGTTRSIFSGATMLNSIYTDQGATLEYNYTYAEDWGDGTNGERYVTYGWEVKESAEYADESMYSGDKRWYTNPENSSQLSAPFNFSTGFLPYVATPYNSTKDPVTGCFQRELKVNVISEDGLTQGCGTYNDPYVISKNGLLEEVAYFIAEGGQGIPSINLPKNASDYDTLAENAHGNRWCQNKNDHVTYAPKNGDTTKYSATGFEDWNNDTIRLYLANAYYVIDGDLELSSSYVGLGGTQANYAFRGVIVGNENTITNKSEKPFINVSNGCVVKDLTVVVAEDGITLSQANNTYSNAYFGYASQCKYYGGIIGEIMGGDNIIDNSYVKFSYQDADDNSQTTQITLSGANGTIVPVGGYVGVVVFGALIFKNMTPNKTTVSSTHLNVIYHDGNTATTNGVNLAEEKITVNNQEVKNEEAWAAIYVNPIVGRVINGYAVNETETNAEKGTVGHFSISEDGHYHDDANNGAGTVRSGELHQLKNGRKHYSIADIDKSQEDMLDVTRAATSAADGNIDVPNSQALFILSLITQSCAGTAPSDGDYVGSLSYGTYGTTASVYGMSHLADYSDVGTTVTDYESVSDYNEFASMDTASNFAIPYIIRHYTVSNRSETVTNSREVFAGDTIPENAVFLISNTRNSTTGYMIQEENRSNVKSPRTCYMRFTDDYLDAAEVHFEVNPENSQQYSLWMGTDDNKQYLKIVEKEETRGNLELSATPYYFTIEKRADGYWYIQGTTSYPGKTAKQIINRDTTYGFCAYASDSDPGFPMEFSTKKTVITYGDYSFPARSVTTTGGYYAISLKSGESYALPDSFRGLGCVGIWDSETGADNKFSLKISSFDGKGCSIDEDVYINKYWNDNYFNTLHKGKNQLLNDSANDGQTYLGNTTNGRTGIENHGIGFFDSVIMKSSNTMIKNFILSGVVNAELYDNNYSVSRQKLEKVETVASGSASLWLCVGGVCGWMKNGTTGGFESIVLNNLSVSGADFVGGILGYSGLSSTTEHLTIRKCSANGISVEMTSSRNIETGEKARNGMGCFVGKVQEGAVYIYGTMDDDHNNDSAQLSTVIINDFGFADSTKEYFTSAGGLVGFAGDGCKIYDMKIKPADGKTITIGNDKVRFAGGFVGGMQSQASGGTSGIAVFKNCVVDRVNVNGNFAGGFYGGKWDSKWTTYTITLDNCQMLGSDSAHNTIHANNLNKEGCAGGLIGRLYPYTNKVSGVVTHNVLIKDCQVLNYDITAANSKTSYVGGFVGYADSATESVTCYIHDSSVENCTIGASGNYAGGILGRLIKKNANQILGYNIKLDTITSGSGNKMGAWIGYVDTSDKASSIQFTGMAIYGTGFTKNIGNDVTLGKASFVFADYDGKCKTAAANGVSPYESTNNVLMPRHPYVNVNPQYDLGGGQLISGDGAVLRDTALAGYGTAAKTMAAHIWADIQDSSNSRRYTTFSDDVISGTNTIETYMQRQATDDGDRISTFKTERGNRWTNSKDFAVVVIANTDNSETTNLINRYIQLVTNTTTNYAADDASNAYYDIVVKTCKYNSSNSQFEIVTEGNEATPGLTYQNGVFALNGSRADSNRDNTFTLVDVQFKDPFNTTQVAYHLYVPVYTIKQMTYKFYTTALTGTDSVQYNASNVFASSVYEDALGAGGTHIDSLETWLTQYVRFEYDAEDIQLLLDTGNLNWNFAKTMSYDTQPNSYKLPDQTFMMLVDPNGGADKVYSAAASNFTATTGGNGGWKVDFDHFTYSDNGVSRIFAARPFKDILAQSITRTANAGHGKYNEISVTGDEIPANYSLCYVDNGVKKYYQYVEASNGAYDFTISDDFQEDYYISIRVPKPEGYTNQLYYFSVTPSETISGNRTAKIVQGHYTNFNLLIADLYSQDTTVKYEVGPSEQLITGSNNVLTAEMVTSIRITNPNAKTYLSGSHLYHAFKIALNKYESGGKMTSTITDNGLPQSGVSAAYGYTTDAYANQVPPNDVTSSVVMGNDYILVPTTDIMTALLACTGDQAVTVYGKVIMDYNDTPAELAKGFPERGAGEDNVGTNVAASSNLAYNTAGLAYSSMTKAFAKDWHFYYRESVNKALLNYYVTDDLDINDKEGEQSGNKSRAGVNGRTSKLAWMPINTKASYNVGVLDNYSTGDKIRLTITMRKKTDTFVGGVVDSVDYADIATIANYASFTSVKSGNTSFALNSTLSTPGKLVYEADSAGCSLNKGYYDFDISFSAWTGAGFKEYANYRVYLQAELINTTLGKTVENSLVTDYVVYTNAKIYPEVIK